MTELARRAVIAGTVGALCAAGVVVAATRPDGNGADAPAGSASTGRWRALEPSPLERTEVAAARIGGHIYVVGGFDSSDGETTAAGSRYSIRRDRWKRLKPMPVAVNHPTATSYRGKLFVHGGFTSAAGLSDPTSALQVYSPKRKRWARLPDSPTPRAAHALGEIEGMIYAAAGANDGSAQLSSLEIYDVAARRWTAGPDLNVGRNHVGATVEGGRLYVLGGRDGSGMDFQVSERFDPATGAWKTLAPLETARSGFAAVTVKAKVVAFGGEELGPGATTIEQVELYDPAGDTWTALPDMRTARHGLGGASKGRRVFALEGGPDPGLAFSRALEFLDVPRRLAD